MPRLSVLLFCIVLSGWNGVVQAESREPVWPGFAASPHFGEQAREMKIEVGEPGMRLRILAPGVGKIDPDKPSRVVFFATPNGNTVEQTLGCKMVEGRDWHFDIQHIAAQHRKYQSINTRENLVLVCLQSDIRSWPTWRRKHENNAELIRQIVADVLEVIPLDDPKVTFASHSGGGSFMFGFINGSEEIPEWVDRLIFLDANYGYDDADKHGDKLIAWLNGDEARRLIVMAYDDREITYKGKKVVSDTGGTYRATHRMLDRFSQDGEIDESEGYGFRIYDALNGRAQLLIHPNPENIILHTRMVGEMNGHLYAMALDTPEQGQWGMFGGPRAYMDWVQPQPEGYTPEPEELGGADEAVNPSETIPARPVDALGGREFMLNIADLDSDDRDAAIRDELLRGNIPDFLRQFVSVHTRAKIGDDSELSVTFQVMPDYLAVGSDEDFVRVPVTPMTAQAVADAFGCVLPTRMMVNDIYTQAVVKLPPLPLTEERTATTSFLQHQGLIEWQRQQAGAELGQLTAGIKKDLVTTNKLKGKPNRVAIYGWHLITGKPIQPVYVGHVDSYVDYSHGARLVCKTIQVGDEGKTIGEVLADPDLAALLSDEGVIDHPGY